MNSPAQSENLRRVLVELIKHGADVNATDQNGNSVTNLAFHHSVPQRKLGTYLADLWACSLVACGYDVFVDFQNSQLRLPCFDAEYTMNHFQTLWHDITDRSYILTNIAHLSKETLNDACSTILKILRPGELGRLLEIEPCLFEGLEQYQWAFDLQQADISPEAIQSILTSYVEWHQGRFRSLISGSPPEKTKAEDTVYRLPKPGFHHTLCCHQGNLRSQPLDTGLLDSVYQPSQTSLVRLMEPLARHLFFARTAFEFIDIPRKDVFEFFYSLHDESFEVYTMMFADVSSLRCYLPTDGRRVLTTFTSHI